MQAYRRALAVLAGLFALSVPAAVDVQPGMWLEIPDLQVRVEGNGAATIPTTNFNSFTIRLGKQASQVDYGSIYARINTEAANIIMTTASTEAGIVCRFDLARFGGFGFHLGRNSVEISYKDRAERLHYASFLLQTSERPPQIRPPAQGHPERLVADKYAVIIGISRYRNTVSGLTNLRYADHDAQAFRDFLLSPEGGAYRPANILFLVNEDATAERVRSALFTFLTKPRADDVVVLYFAGHGAADPNDRRNLYLLTYDTRPDDMGGTAFPMWQLQDVFARVLKARRVVTFTDSCHSYGISGQRYGGSAKTNNLINQYLARYATEADRAIITASDISQLSFESDQWGGGHGVFTYFLLQGLRGEADYNKDGTVTAGELFAYVREHVEQATGGAQTPVAFPGLAEQLPLSGLKTYHAGPPAP